MSLNREPTSIKVYSFPELQSMFFFDSIQNGKFVFKSAHDLAIKELEDEQVLHIELLSKEYNKVMQKKDEEIQALREFIKTTECVCRYESKKTYHCGSPLFIKGSLTYKCRRCKILNDKPWEQTKASESAKGES